MKLGRKILITIVIVLVLNALMTLFVVQGAYLAGDSFKPELGDSLVAPDIAPIAATLLVSVVALSYLMFWLIRKQVLDPIAAIAVAADRLGSGDHSLLSLNRQDEIGKLALIYNTLAENVIESNRHIDDRIRAATDKVERNQRELAFAERLVATGRLAASTAGEIDQPLGGMLNAVTSLRASVVDPEKAGQAADVLEDGIRRIQAAARRLIPASRKRQETTTISVVTPLYQALDLLRHLLKPNHITLAIHIEESGGNPEHLKVMADAGDLIHIFYNLLSNSIDAMPRGGMLTINVYQALKWVVVEIVDTGVGLTVDELSMSFDYFHTTKPVGKGTGLGLPIAHHIAVGYRGALTLNSRKGEGAKATVELPGIATRTTVNFRRRSNTRFVAGGGVK